MFCTIEIHAYCAFCVGIHSVHNIDFSLLYTHDYIEYGYINTFKINNYLERAAVIRKAHANHAISIITTLYHTQL